MKKISKSELNRLYSENTNDYVCEVLQISLPTLISLLVRAGIPRKGKGNRKYKRKVFLED